MSVKGLQFTSFDAYQKGGATIKPILVKVDNLSERLDALANSVLDTSWIKDIISKTAQKSFSVAAGPTLLMLEEQIKQGKETGLSSDTGEHLVTDTAVCALEQNFSHVRLPLPEIYKPKKSGNGGYDFHTRTKCQSLNFGESKFVSSGNSYDSSIKQTVRFIGEKRDVLDYQLLENLGYLSEVGNFDNGNKHYTSAFTVSANNVEHNMKLSIDYAVLKYDKSITTMYLVGVCFL